MSESTLLIEDFRRWGYLQANLDPFQQIEKIYHPDLERHKNSPEYQRYSQIYCGSIGLETSHITNPDYAAWICKEFENQKTNLSSKFIFKRILQAEMFEKFMHTRYVGVKRFSLEGLASMIPALDSVLESVAEKGFEKVVIGMAHRGRLNVMWTITQSSAQNIFACIEDVDPESNFGSGDVKYHKGSTGEYITQSGKKLNIHLASKPSHLEAINPVVM